MIKSLTFNTVIQKKKQQPLLMNIILPVVPAHNVPLPISHIRFYGELRNGGSWSVGTRSRGHTAGRWKDLIDK